MFTSLTIAAAWFAFGYSVTSLFLIATKNHSNGNYDEVESYRDSGHYGPKD